MKSIEEDKKMSFIINILSTPAILVGLISLFGLILQKKPVEDVVKGTVKTIVGFLVLTAGSSFLQTGSLNDFGVIFNYAFNMQGVVPNNEAIVSLGLADFASDTAYIMCIGMIANIVLARFQDYIIFLNRTSHIIHVSDASYHFKCWKLNRTNVMDLWWADLRTYHGNLTSALPTNNGKNHRNR